MKLTKAQHELLVWIESQPQGVVDITDESMVRRLVDRGLVLKFFESDGGPLAPVWTITPAGRLALQSTPRREVMGQVLGHFSNRPHHVVSARLNEASQIVDQQAKHTFSSLLGIDVVAKSVVKHEACFVPVAPQVIDQNTRKKLDCGFMRSVVVRNSYHGPSIRDLRAFSSLTRNDTEQVEVDALGRTKFVQLIAGRVHGNAQLIVLGGIGVLLKHGDSISTLCRCLADAIKIHLRSRQTDDEQTYHTCRGQAATFVYYKSHATRAYWQGEK